MKPVPSYGAYMCSPRLFVCAVFPPSWAKVGLYDELWDRMYP